MPDYKDCVPKSRTEENSRYIIIIDDKMSEDDKDLLIKQINDSLFYIIRDINATIGTRIIPYIQVRKGRESDKKVRMLIGHNDNDFYRNDDEESCYDIDKESHVIILESFGSQRIVAVSDGMIKGSAKIYVDEKDRAAAAVDIFLDIAMFNSYSFLNAFNISRRQDFSKEKYKYYINHLSKKKSYYRVDDTRGILSYYSFAFNARSDRNKIDILEYIDIWDQFMSDSYKNEINIIPSPSEQLKGHKDYEMIPKKYKTNRFWIQKGKGSYLLLKVNKKVSKNNRSYRFKQLSYYYYNSKTIGCNRVAVVPLSEYFNPMLHRFIEEKVITVYKIIVG